MVSLLLLFIYQGGGGGEPNLLKRPNYSLFALWSQCPLVQLGGKSPRGEIIPRHYLGSICADNYCVKRFVFLLLKDEPLQTILLSSDNLGLSAVTNGDHTSSYCLHLCVHGAGLHVRHVEALLA